MRRYEVVVKDVTPASYDITVWRDGDGVRVEVFGEPCRYVGDLMDAVADRLRRGEWRVTSPWTERDGTLVADVEPVMR